MKYYSLKKILERKAVYNVIFGERSNGKSFAVHEYALKDFVERGAQLALIRREDVDFVGKRGAQMFDGIVDEGRVEKITKGKWTGIYYRGRQWFLMRYDEDGDRVIDSKPFAFAFALSSMEHDKSTSYPDVKNILYDEFISRKPPLINEFVLFMNVLSTIIRQRTDVKIFMLGNTVNRACLYFSEMGLKHISKMKPGDIDVYEYGDSKLSVAVEYTEPNVTGKPSDFYFAFDSPRLNMITRGGWEIASYPHCPVKFKPKHVRFTFFIIFNYETLQAEIVHIDNAAFIFIHRKTTELQNPDRDLIYSLEYDPRRNWHRDITRPTDKPTQFICDMFAADKVYYQDNDVGEIVRNYLQWCRRV